MSALLSVVYGVGAYVFFLGTFLYAVAFAGNLGVPKSIDVGPSSPIFDALVINILLLGVFAVQHSVMARPAFKRWWTRIVPPVVERSTFVVAASLALALLLWQWRPIPGVVWNVENHTFAAVLNGVFWAGWAILLISTFLINHFELFGLHQVIFHLASHKMADPTFKTPLFYKFVRHPIYLGFIIAFWSAPVMTVGHMLFAAVTTAYIFVGIFLEVRDLVELFGDKYVRYRERVGMLIPWRRSGEQPTRSNTWQSKPQ